jgi:hypothetical protein
MRKTGLGRPVDRAASFLRKGVKVVEAAEVLILRLLLFCTLVYHFVHGFFTGK